MDLSELVVSALVVALAVAAFALLSQALTGYWAGLNRAVEEATTLATAVPAGNGVWYVEVVWTYRVAMPKSFLLSNGTYYPVSLAQTLGSCPTYSPYPAPHWFCIFVLSTSSEPVGVVES